jgi:thioredoxin reductase (NADPH)
MAEPVDMPLYGSLYVADGTKESLLGVWETILANTGVQVRTQERVESVIRVGTLFRVSTNRGLYATRSIVLALGKRGSPRKLDVPGEDLAKVSYRLIEADTYNDRDILVVGGGDSSIEAALALSKASKNRVALAYRGSSFDRARDRNRNLLRDAEQQGRLRVLRNTTVSAILPDRVRLNEDGLEVAVPNDYVFVLFGGESPETFLRKIGIEIVEKVIGAQNTYELA